MPRKTTSTKSKIFDFEKSLTELEALVEKLEQGELSLEESLKQFEHGITLTRACQHALKTAEQKVQILIEKNGENSIQPFDAAKSDPSEQG